MFSNLVHNTASTKAHGGWEFYKLKINTSRKTQLGKDCHNSLNGEGGKLLTGFRVGVT